MVVHFRRIIIGVCLVAVTVLGISTGLVGMIWERCDNVMRPWQRGLVHETDATFIESPSAADAVGVREQMLHLGAENTFLRQRLAEYESIRGEGAVDPHQAIIARARIIGRTVRAGRRYVELDAGALDGVSKGQAVCVGWSLVGVVAGLQDGRCLVQQVTDSGSRIAAAIVNHKEMIVEGVLTGTGERAQLELTLVEDRPGLAIAPGTAVVTLGTDGGVPAGLVLGTVTEAQSPVTTNHWRIAVAPVRTVEAAESLLIIGGLKRPESR